MVISDPARNQHIVIANLTTMNPGDTEPCVIRPGDHRFVSRNSVIAYDFVKIRPSAGIEKLASCGMLSPSDDLSAALLARIQRAVGASSEVDNEAKDVLRAQGFI